jgi:hypothetical protein
MMYPEFFKLSPLSVESTISTGSDGPEVLQRLLLSMGWSLFLSFNTNGGSEIQRWISPKGRRAVDLQCMPHLSATGTRTTHSGVGSSLAAQKFNESLEELQLDVDEAPEVFAFFFKHPSMLDVIAFFNLDPEDRMAIVN